MIENNDNNNNSQLETNNIQNHNINEIGETVQNNKKKKNPIIFIIIGIIFLFAGAGIYLFLLKPVSAKMVKNKSIDFIFDKLTKVEDDILDNLIFDYNNQKILEEGTVTFDIKSDDKNLVVPDNISNIKFNYDINLDIKGKQILINTTTNQNSKDIFDLNAFLKNNTAYLNSNLFNNAYKINLEEPFNWEMLSSDQNTKEQLETIKRITKSIQKKLKNSVKDEYLKQKSGEFTLDGKKIKGLKTTFEITAKTTNNILIDLYEKIANDEKLLKDLTKFANNISTKELKENIKKEIKSLKKEIESIEKHKQADIVSGEINIYTTKRGKFLGLELRSNEEFENMKTIMTARKEKDEIIINNNSSEEATEFTYNTKNKELKTKDFSIKFLEKGIEFQYEKENGIFNIKLSNKKSEKELSTNIEAFLKYPYENNSYIEIKLNCDSKTKAVSEIKPFDTSKAKNIDEITEEEAKKIFTNLKNKSKGTFLEGIVNSIDSLINNNDYEDYYNEI